MRTALIAIALLAAAGCQTVAGSRAALLVTDASGAELQRALVVGEVEPWPGGGWHIQQGGSDVVGTAMPETLGRQDMRITVTTPERQRVVEGAVSFTERTWTGVGAAPWRTRGWLEVPGEPRTDSALHTLRVELDLQPPMCPAGAPCGIPWSEEVWLQAVAPLAAPPDVSCDEETLDRYLGSGAIRVLRTGIELPSGRVVPCLRIPDASTADFDVWLTCGATYDEPGAQCTRRVTLAAHQARGSTILKLDAIDVCNEDGNDLILEACDQSVDLGDGR